MGSGRIRAIGQFAWIDADIGVECRRCGRVQIYCDFEATVCFRERRWAPGVEEAIKQFRCRCGSADVVFRPVSITKRPKPLPPRPAPLRPIYAEPAGSLFRRGASVPADPAALDAAVAELSAAADRRTLPEASVDALAAAIEVVRPHLYDQGELAEFVRALGDTANLLWRGTAIDGAMKGILRQLGRQP